MIRFLIKGILRDKNRSLIPVMVVTAGVAITVITFCWLNGIMDDSFSMNANLLYGHLKVTTKAYARESAQMPLELALLGTDSLTGILKKEYPDFDWVQRIRFGALIDFPDSTGETRAQGPVTGWAIDLLSSVSNEAVRFNILDAVVEGSLPSSEEEALISADLAKRFNVSPGDKFTLFGTTMDGSLAFKNFYVSGLVKFGSEAIDRGAVITDISGARKLFRMDNGATEILGFFKDGYYYDEKALTVSGNFNRRFSSDDEFSPVMLTFSQQEGMGDLLVIVKVINFIFIFIFVAAMSVVLWNTGLLQGLRRYSEFGVRLAIGEEKKHIYQTLIIEGLVTGTIGTVFGTAVGLIFAYLLQKYGMDLGSVMENASVMMPTIARAHITHAAFYIGFIPGLLSTVFGNALAGIGIYKRNTAMLFKELEV